MREERICQYTGSCLNVSKALDSRTLVHERTRIYVGPSHSCHVTLPILLHHRFIYSSPERPFITLTSTAFDTEANYDQLVVRRSWILDI